MRSGARQRRERDGDERRGDRAHDHLAFGSEVEAARPEREREADRDDRDGHGARERRGEVAGRADGADDQLPVRVDDRAARRDDRDGTDREAEARPRGAARGRRASQRRAAARAGGHHRVERLGQRAAAAGWSIRPARASAIDGDRRASGPTPAISRPRRSGSASATGISPDEPAGVEHDDAVRQREDLAEVRGDEDDRRSRRRGARGARRGRSRVAAISMPRVGCATTMTGRSALSSRAMTRRWALPPERERAGSSSPAALTAKRRTRSAPIRVARARRGARGARAAGAGGRP